MKQLKRIRDWMEVPGRFGPGPLNAITDVPGVTVGHYTHMEGADVRTGITVVRPHGGNPFMHRCPAAVFSGNGHTKAAGALQVMELGELESAVALTSTLSVGPVLEGLVRYHLDDMAGASFRSLNAFVMETNDGELSDITGGHIRPEHVALAFDACSRAVAEGGVGAGTGDTCFGFKGGMGTASRVIPARHTGLPRDYTLGVLVQANFGGNLNIYGHALPLKPLPIYEDTQARGSVSIVVATDAPLSDTQLRRVAARAIIGIGATGSYLGNSSGDFVLAFSNNEKNLRDFARKTLQPMDYCHNDCLNPFFECTVDATREAVYNCLCMAETMTGWQGNTFRGFDITAFRDMLPLKG